MKTGSNIYYYHTDHLGSSSVMTDTNGNKVEDLYYYPYGKVYTDTGSIKVKHKFTGQELDTESGLYYYGARYYEPEIGRFISADSIVQDYTDPQTLNRYSYCRNNPVILTDPSGNFFVEMLIGAVIGALMSGVQSDWNFQAMVTGGVIGGISGGIFSGVEGAVAGSLASSVQAGAISSTTAGAISGAAGGAVGFGAGLAISQIVESTVIIGMVGGAAGGATASALSGGNVLQGMALGTAGGAVGGWVAGLKGVDPFGKLVLGAFGAGIVGGIGSELSGGTFSQGMMLSAMNAVTI